MNDAFVSWKLTRDSKAATGRAQVEAAARRLPRAEQFEGALKAARDVARANGKGWESRMALWGFRK